MATTHSDCICFDCLCCLFGYVPILVDVRHCLVMQAFPTFRDKQNTGKYTGKYTGFQTDVNKLRVQLPGLSVFQFSADLFYSMFGRVPCFKRLVLFLVCKTKGNTQVFKLLLTNVECNCLDCPRFLGF